MIKIKLILPDKVSTNKAVSGWKHWSIRKKYNDIFHEAMFEYKNKFKMETYPVIISYSFHWRTRALDTTNQTIMMKMIEDGMRYIGLLEDDDPKHVRTSICSSIVDKDTAYDYVIIVIESSPLSTSELNRLERKELQRLLEDLLHLSPSNQQTNQH